jgi:quinolinate synthase
MTKASAIESIKKKLGSDLAILAHHYQTDEVVRHAHFRGDSLELARRIPELSARYIVFCGVHFMAESAAILAGPEQKVFIPDPSASCVMADMTPAALAETVLKRLRSEGKNIIPLTYVNSSAAVKALCGRFGGSVCTSANAPKMLAWALSRGDGVLFMPDMNLGRNTARDFGIPPEAMRILDVRQGGSLVEPAGDDGTRIFLWPGCCAIHFKFKADDLDRLRSAHPEARIVVHPECDPEVVSRADGAGSTTYLIRETAQAPDGSTIIVGTEYNLVNRLAREHAGRITVLPVKNVVCSNMVKTTEDNLLALLENLDRAKPVTVPQDIAAPAARALETMLAVCS